MSSNKDKIIEDNLYETLYNSELSNKFYHYTNSIAIENIMKSQEIRLSFNENLNDNNDVNKDCFIFCLTTSHVESIPMWYLYTGINGSGVRLEFTKMGINKIMNSPFYYKKENLNISIPLEKIKVAFEPILYYEENPTTDKEYSGYYRIKFKNYVYYTTKELIDEFRNNHSSFSKNMEWSYEKETRLNIKILDKSLMQIINQNHYIYFDINQLKQHMSITLGPYFQNEKLKTDLIAFLGEHKVHTSNLNGRLNIDLCKGCTYKKI